ncbi:heat shock 70 kDa protein 12A-like [Saccostrea echinata]|uniref:heat shock 70 kDa protein 12A-like n=1 Tax=Saccostrea echinata TaxID=191078 RepID=UPI002A7F3D08|nr:heat shock 70 kDa protein 12A-like [Saccostrea echinata]
MAENLSPNTHDPNMSNNNSEEEQSIESTLNDQNYLFVVALDFGTTYSGYAFSSRDQFRKNPLDIHSHQNWTAGGTALISLKTPTSLLIDKDGNFVAFGYEAEDTFYSEVAKDQRGNFMLFRRFKMKLHNKKGISDNLYLEDVAGKGYPAKHVFTLSIKALVDHFKENIRRSLNIEFTATDLRWVLTVPAIWNDAAKEYMRQCAIKAGIPDKMLKIALEPEAASIYCQFLPIERNPDGFGMTKEGTKYMIVDIGGGTADITVHEKIKDGKLRELHQATGGACGGTAVDREFEIRLTGILGENIMKKLRTSRTETYLDIFREFEVAKRVFTPNSTGPIRMTISYVALNELSEEIEGKTLKTMFENAEGMQLKLDKLHIDVATMKKFFEQSVKELIQHMQDVMQSPQTNGISLILLVGGSADSKYIQSEVTSAFDSVRLIIPPEAGLAVLKGAVIFGHDPTLIKSRILRFTYGTSVCEKFNPNIHKEEKKITIDGEDISIDCFKMILSAGTEVDIGHKVIAVYSTASVFQSGAEVKIFCTPKKEIKYTDEEGCFLLGKLFIPLPLNLLMGILGIGNQKEQPFVVAYIFGDTELKVMGKDMFSSTFTSCSLKMREEEVDEMEHENED